MDQLQFTKDLLTRPELSGIDAVTTLRHFAIISYAIEPERLLPHLHPRFEPELITDERGHSKALISVVPFLDVDFRYANCPWPKFSFGQTNYRIYVRDNETGEHAVWFLGTTLDSWTVKIPHYLWKLPWHPGRMRFDCCYSDSMQRYLKYRMQTSNGWAPVRVSLSDTGQPIDSLIGFPTLEAGLVVLTHPLRGYYYRLDGKMGSYKIWHDRLKLTQGSCLEADFTLLDRLDLVPRNQQLQTHSVLLQYETEFTIYLPPSVVLPDKPLLRSSKTAP